MNIQIAHSEDKINDALSIRKAVFVDEQQIPLAIELDEHDQSATHLIGYLENEAICASRLRIIENSGKLERISVLRQHRQNGYGLQMIHKMEDILVSKNISKSILNAQVQAVEFYERLGYHVVSEPFTEANIDHVTMEKDLR